MAEVTQILSQIEQGDPTAAERLLPTVYCELRNLAAAKLARENPGQTLQATALVHEAYLRLVDGGRSQSWNGSGHFFGAAAEAMRRILVENARRKQTVKRGGRLTRQDRALSTIEAPDDFPDILALDDALEKLAREDVLAAEVVKLRFFTGLTVQESAKVLGISPRKTDLVWAFARAWLRRELADR